MTGHSEEALGRAADAILALAVTVREEGLEAVTAAAAKALAKLDGDALAAITVAACLIDVDSAVVRWWQPDWPGSVDSPRLLFGGPRELTPCGTYAAYRRHVRADEPIDAACIAARREYHRTNMARHRAQAVPA